jgi:hypothetical protein
VAEILVELPPEERKGGDTWLNNKDSIPTLLGA